MYGIGLSADQPADCVVDVQGGFHGGVPVPDLVGTEAVETADEGEPIGLRGVLVIESSPFSNDAFEIIAVPAGGALQNTSFSDYIYDKAVREYAGGKDKKGLTNRHKRIII